VCHARRIPRIVDQFIHYRFRDCAHYRTGGALSLSRAVLTSGQDDEEGKGGSASLFAEGIDGVAVWFICCSAGLLMTMT